MKRGPFRWYYRLFAFALVCSWSIALPVESKARYYISKKTLKKLQQRNQKKLPGVIMAAMQKGKVVYQGSFGYADIQKKIKMTLKSRIDVASVSKQFTAVAAAIAIEKGLIKYHQPITDWFSDVPQWRTIEVQNLVHHTSGLVDHDDFCAEETKNRLMFKHILFWLKDQKLLSTPGEKFRYSNTGYLLLAEIIARASKMPFTEFIEKHIFNTLGMKDTEFFSPGKKLKNLAISYHMVKKNRFEPDMDNACNHLVGDGGIVTTVGDFLKWARAITGDSGFISNNIKKQIFTPGLLKNGSRVTDDGDGYGLGYFIDDTKNARVFYHSGEWLSYSSYVAYYPDEDYWEVAFANNLDLEVANLFEE